MWEYLKFRILYKLDNVSSNGHYAMLNMLVLSVLSYFYINLR